MKNNKGITLIALIITIIVMLILVATTVSIVVNSDLIGTAQGAKTNTELHAVNDQTYGMNVIIDGKNHVSVEDYANGVETIDPNGEYILHVFGKKFRIGEDTTMQMLDEATEAITVEDYFINGKYAFPADTQILYADDIEGYSGPVEYTPVWGDTVGTPLFFNEGDYTTPPLVRFLTSVCVAPGDWMGEEALDSLEELKTLEGFEENSIYIE